MQIDETHHLTVKVCRVQRTVIDRHHGKYQRKRRVPLLTFLNRSTDVPEVFHFGKSVNFAEYEMHIDRDTRVLS